MDTTNNVIMTESCDDDCPELIEYKNSIDKYKCLDTNDVSLTNSNIKFIPYIRYIKEYGDLDKLNADVYVTLSLPVLKNTKCDQIVDELSIFDKVEYCKFPGTKLLNCIQFSVNGNIIDHIEEDRVNTN